jgi:hypothetical protein
MDLWWPWERVFMGGWGGSSSMVGMEPIGPTGSPLLTRIVSLTLLTMYLLQ